MSVLSSLPPHPSQASGTTLCRTRRRISKTHVDVCLENRCACMRTCVLTDFKALACVIMEQQTRILQQGRQTVVRVMLLLQSASQDGRILPRKASVFFLLSPLGDCLGPAHYRELHSVSTELKQSLLTRYLHNNQAGNWQTSRYHGLVKLTHTINLHVHRGI